MLGLPWTEISADAIGVVRRHARSAYPAEACGLLLGLPGTSPSFPGRVVEAVPTPNATLADPRTRFAIDPRKLGELEREAEALGACVSGVYHSHPEGSPSPSELDHVEAWPGYLYLIAAVDPRSVGRPRAFRWDAWTDGLGEVPWRAPVPDPIVPSADPPAVPEPFQRGRCRR